MLHQDTASTFFQNCSSLHPAEKSNCSILGLFPVLDPLRADPLKLIDMTNLGPLITKCLF